MSIDEMMNQFRVASRELFNYFFRVPNPYAPESNGWVLEERFREVENILFQKLVTEPACLMSVEYGYVQSEIGVELRLCEFSPIMINREMNSGYWDYPTKEVTKDVKLAFLRTR